MRILCVCNHGNNRSGALARILKSLNGDCHSTETAYRHKYSQIEALAIGAHCNTDETLRYLINWADKVVDLSDGDLGIQELLEILAKEKYIRKIIGSDVWGSPAHPELLSLLEPFAKELIK